MQSYFQLPLELLNLPDKEFWENVSNLDEMGEHIAVSDGGFAISYSDGNTQVKIPFIRFKKNIPSSQS